MKPLYWKLLLILGAMVVGASLVVPKALRKNTPHGVDNVSQTLFLTSLNQNPVHDVADVAVGKVKYLPTPYTANFSKLSSAIAIRFIAKIDTPTYSLNAGTRPTKARVID